MRKTSVLTATFAFALSALLILVICAHQGWQVVVAYHVLDVPPHRVSEFQFFFWAAWLTPIAWLVSFALGVVELRRGARTALLALYVGVPLAIATIIWVAWKGFIAGFTA